MKQSLANDDIETARSKVLTRITAATRIDGQPGRKVKLVAVSKRQPADRIDAMLAVGQRVFGENRVQEARDHWADRILTYPDVELRLIGPLQSNKAADAVALFDVIETLDRDKLAGALRVEMDKQRRSPRLYVQVNTGEETQKAGIIPSELSEFMTRLRSHYGLSIEGLMCIPPIAQPAGLHFTLLAKLAAENNVKQLSMGMSSDFELAVRLGATSVRIGSAVFGKRES
jgi:pyridoxal phosphate enzyme (YggS family)